MLFYGDSYDIKHLFLKMKRANYFYFSNDAKDLIATANPKFKDVYKRRKCIRKLKYIGEEEYDHIAANFKKGKIYTSAHYNGSAYTINLNGEEIVVGSLYFERVS